ncbi:V-set and immunoglobulin domain-containing protein 1-like [Poecilia formosa]|uniref:V-set and immunoglobulin domain-containing protein 1-like n=1 Tax=Poecilia formosa TaxID=48698 RepID=UPI0007B8C652|nr:PREDICTED: V-set and immunoglobulin domain-containing protein 1-like [Poecilia formosa]
MDILQTFVKGNRGVIDVEANILMFFKKLFVFPGLITVNVLQGSDAILPCSPTTKEDLSSKSFEWRKDGQNVFYYDAGSHYNDGLDGQDPQFKDRVSFFEDQLGSGNASIQIQNVMIQDSGNYRCEILGIDPGSQMFDIKLVVDVPKYFATQNNDVTLPCSPIGKDNLIEQVFDWKKNDGKEEVLIYGKKNKEITVQNQNFENRVEIFQNQLEFGNASICIKNTKWEDSGIYTCEFPRLQPSGQKFYVELVVYCILTNRTIERPGQRPILSIEKTADGRRVTCSVFGVSNIEMDLHNLDDGTVDKSTSNKTSQNTQYFMFSVTKEGNYSCVVKNKKDCYQIYSEKSFVEISDTKNGAEDGSKVKLVLLLLLVVVGLLLP